METAPLATTAGAILMASLVGSVHCAGMCGGFTCVYAEGPAGDTPPHGVRSSVRRGLTGHALYNVGRLAAYLLLGALAGIAGARVTDAGSLVGVREGATLLAAMLMIGWGVSALAAQRGATLGPVRVPERWQRMVGSLLRTVRSRPSGVRALVMGLVTTLLPCGWLYVFVAMAGGTGNVFGAMALMGFFWLGTVPAMLTVGMGLQALTGPLRRRLPVVSAVVVLGLGVLSIAGQIAGGERRAAGHTDPGRPTMDPVHGAHAGMP